MTLQGFCNKEVKTWQERRKQILKRPFKKQYQKKQQKFPLLKIQIKGKPEQKDGQKIYIGVSVPGMKSGTVFTGKIPKVIDVDFVRELCVPIEKLSETLKKKAVTGSRVAYCYQQSAKLAQQLKK